jgi:hypothetical protein
MYVLRSQTHVASQTPWPDERQTDSPPAALQVFYIFFVIRRSLLTMLFSIATLAGMAALAAQVHGHAVVTKPAVREPSDATAAACGKLMVQFYKADNTSYPEALLRANPKGLTDGYDAKKCNLWLCKGFQFGDNSAHVYTYKPGDVVDMEVYLRIPHKGYANVSVVDTTTNTVIGSPLLSWPDNYFGTMNPPKNQTKFSVTVPDLGSKCTVPGVCVSCCRSACLCETRLATLDRQFLTCIGDRRVTGHPVVLARAGPDVRELHRFHANPGNPRHSRSDFVKWKPCLTDGRGGG